MAPEAAYCWTPGEDRYHAVYQFTEDIFKVIQWYRVPFRTGPGPKEQRKHYDKKLDSSISRTRRVLLEKALCNDWEWFVTLTINGELHDRTDLSGWGERFKQWMRDLRKKGRKIRYLLVPERHKKNGWHCHGFISGLLPEDTVTFADLDKAGVRSRNGRRLPRYLINSGFYNWPAYQKKFGFCSLGRICNPAGAGFYVTKYITKEKSMMVSTLGLNSYYSNQGLNVARKYVVFFGRDVSLDALLSNKYDFCATGFTTPADPLDWHERFADMAEAYTDFSLFKPLNFSAQPANDDRSPAEQEADSYYEFEQLCFSSKLPM